MGGKLNLNNKLLNRILMFIIVALIAITLIGANEVISRLRHTSINLTELKAEKQALTQEEAYLVSAQKEIKKYSSLEQISQSIVPQDKDQAQTVREIVKIAQSNNISLSGITFPNSNLGNQTGTAPTSSTLSLSQLTPVKGIPGIYELPITVSNSGSNNAVSYSNFYTFLSNLEQNRRTSLVTSLNIQPQKTGLINFSLIIEEYIKPQ